MNKVMITQKYSRSNVPFSFLKYLWTLRDDALWKGPKKVTHFTGSLPNVSNLCL